MHRHYIICQCINITIILGSTFYEYLDFSSTPEATGSCSWHCPPCCPYTARAVYVSKSGQDGVWCIHRLAHFFLTQYMKLISYWSISLHRLTQFTKLISYWSISLHRLAHFLRPIYNWSITVLPIIKPINSYPVSLL